MPRNRCLVELSRDGQVVRIFRHRWQAVQSPAYDLGLVTEWPRFDATGSVRKQVYLRANGECERCGERITYKNGEMDEKVSRGEGGEVSLDNCWMLCHSCHTGENDYSEHGYRRPMFGIKKNIAE